MEQHVVGQFTEKAMEQATERATEAVENKVSILMGSMSFASIALLMRVRCSYSTNVMVLCAFVGLRYPCDDCWS